MRELTDFRLILFLAAFAVTPLSFGQEADKTAEPVEELELLDEVEQPTITIRKPDAAREITELREHGVTREIKVQTGISTYYLYPNNSPGNVLPGEQGATIGKPALWKIHEFDLSGEKPNPTQGEDEYDYTNDAPAPPTSTIVQ